MTVDYLKRRREQDRVGVPDMKKVERTGQNSFVVHTQGKDKFEGKFDSRRYEVKNGQFVRK